MAHRYIFHLVGKDAPFSVSWRTLQKFVTAQFEQGRKSCTLAESITGGDELFTITFDDACKSVITEAFPVLEKLGVKAAVFAPSAFVETTDEFMTWNDLKFLAEHGWTIGAHSVTHSRLPLKKYNEDESAYIARIKYEFLESKHTIELQTGLTVDYFAYPFGEVNSLLKSIAKECGYQGAFSVGTSTNAINDLFDIVRQDPMVKNAELQDDEIKGISVIIPAHNRPEMLEEVLSRLKNQSFPENKYEVIVIDDGSDIPLEKYVKAAGNNFRYFRLEDTGRKFNASAARQKGAELARFPTLAYLDSDIAVNKSYLWGIQWVHHNFEHTICLGYISGYNLDDQDYYHRLEEIAGKDSDVINIIPDRSREPELRSCIDNIQTLDQPWRLCYTGNFSIPRADFFAIGGFQLKFNGWGLEDLEFGFRCHQNGLTWIFSRFVIGYHMTAYDEGKPRNPFKVKNPEKEDFNSYQINLNLLKNLYPTNEVIQDFYQRSIEDIDNILQADKTVGIEFGGRCSHNCSIHKEINKCVAGEVTLEELKDRVLFAKKINADALYLLGGEVLEHPQILDFLHFSSGMGYRITTESNGVIFSSKTFAQKVMEAGLSWVVLKIFSFHEDTYLRITGTNQEKYRKFIDGYEYLKSAGLVTSAKIVFTEINIHEADSLMLKLNWLESDRIELKFTSSVWASHSDEVRRIKLAYAKSPIVELN